MKRIERNTIQCNCGCGESLTDRDSYGRFRYYINGHNGRKYEDRKEYKTAWRLKNKDKIYEREKARKIKLKDECFQAYGNMCQCCGECEIEFLSIDHIEGNGGEHRRETKGNSIYQILKTQGYPNGYRILCFNCNWSSYLGSGICIHKREKENGT